MKLRTKYILFVTIVHLLVLALSFYIFDQDKVYFIVSEVFIIFSIILSVGLYRQLISPVKMLLQGIEAIKDKDFNIKFLTTGKQEVDEMINVYNHMIDELRLERTRQEEQHFFLEKLINTSPTGIVILDHDNRIYQINPRTTEVLKLTEKDLVGLHISETSSLLLQYAANLKPGEAIMVKSEGVNTYKLQRSNFIDRGFQRGFIMIEELTAEILAAEKSVYGKVIRMMAHEVNNTVGPVNSILQTALHTSSLWQNQANRSLSNALQVAFDRNHNLNQFMRNFADLVKLPPPNKKQTDVVQLVKAVIELMRLKAQECNVELIFDLPAKPLIISADAEQLEQALINITKNAIEAIDKQGQVIFNIDTKDRCLSITDNGKGISEQDSAQLFSPFFSTKKDGQGIGLTLVREILLNHGCDISLKTNAELKTVFRIRFN